MKYIVSLIAVAVVATSSPVAFAKETSVRVVYSDLDLTSVAGQQELKSRIARASNFACGIGGGRISLYETGLNQICVSKAREQALLAIRSRTEIQVVSR